MQVSGKIPHSFYRFLLGRGFDLSRFFELSSLDTEVIKNPSGWVDILSVEKMLKRLFQEYSSHFVDEDFIVCVGHSCFELKAWGELDSVLKMRGNQPVFSNLPVFLSYFLSEGFSIRDFKEERGLVQFKSNLSSEHYPFVTEYLRAVMESLPLYTSRGKAEVKWIRNYVQIQWLTQNPQGLLFPSHSYRSLNPEILKDLRFFLEKVEKQLYTHRELLNQKDKEIQKFKDQFLLQGLSLPEEVKSCLKDIHTALTNLQTLIQHEKNFEKTKPLHQTDLALQRLEDLKNNLKNFI